MIGVRTFRPGPDGRPRSSYATLPNVRWRCETGLIHQASQHHNRTLCEMGSNRFIDLFDLRIVAATHERVNCVECIGYPTWLDYPAE